MISPRSSHGEGGIIIFLALIVLTVQRIIVRTKRTVTVVGVGDVCTKGTSPFSAVLLAGKDPCGTPAQLKNNKI
jgi:hypothetical protein